MTRLSSILLSILSLWLLAPLSALALDARPLTAADLPELGGSDFNAGVGDILLRNDKVWAVILAVGATPDFGVPFTAEVLPSAGVLIDAGTVGDRNDELNEIHQLLNLSPDSLVLYGAVVASGVSGDTASVTVAGIALFPGVSTPSSPTIFVTTTYSVTEGNAWIDISSTVTNGNAFPLPIFQVTDADITVSRSRIPFQPFPFRGSKNPPLDLSDPLSSFGAFPFMSTPGVLGPDDGSMNDDGTAKQHVSYTFVPPSLSEPLIGFASPAVVAVGNSFDLAALAAGNPPLLGPGASLDVERRFVISNRNDVESTLDIALPGLGLGTRAELTGRVVDGNGDPVAQAQIFFDNTFPGANPALVGFVTVLDENRDGVADGVIPVSAGDPVPFTHVVTGADGRFTVRLPALSDPFTAPSVYSGQIRASERDYATIAPFSVSAVSLGGPTDLGDLLVSDTGVLDFTIAKKAGYSVIPIPGQLRIFGTGGTPDPNLGSQYSSARSYSGLQPGGGPDAVTGGNSGDLSEAVAGLPALNFAAAANGHEQISLRPGTYRAVATHGLEWDIDEKEFTIYAGQTTEVDFKLRQSLHTHGFVSADFHVHSARSFDSSAPPVDRVTAYAAKGVDVIVSTDHDQITDYTSVIGGLGLGNEITSIVGNETTGTIPVPASANPGGVDAFPQGIGHWNAWPLEFITGARRGGSPADELLPAGAVVDRLRGMDSLKLLGATPDTATLSQWLAAAQAGRPGTPGAGLPVDDEVVMLNHPRAGFAGTVVIGLFNDLGGIGYDPNLPITAFPNSLLNLPSLYNTAVVGPAGTDTTVLSFDALEIQNGPRIRGYQQVRADWFSLLKQGIHRTGMAVADSHRVVLENAGFPRSYVASSANGPASVDEDELTEAIKAMRVTGSSGPFVRFRLFDFGTFQFRGLGETVRGFSSFAVASISVDAAPWIPVEEVRIYKNGELVQTIPIRPHRVLGVQSRFRGLIPIFGISKDSFITVEAGVSVDANGDPTSTSLIADVQTIEPDLEPLGWTNPIFVDRTGNGYVAPGL
jgi:hypothetical protein